MRKRNACLAVLERMRKICGDLQLSDVLAFLYVSENEGINVRELAQLTRLDSSTASRAARRLAAPTAPEALPPALGLFDIHVQCTDRRGRTIHLTPAGIELRKSVDDLITEGVPIVLK